jgi:hypothetical protein
VDGKCNKKFWEEARKRERERESEKKEVGK